MVGLTSLPLFRVEARRGGRRQEAELGPQGATPSKRNLCPGACRPPPCKGTPAVLLRTHPTWLLLWKTGAALFLMKSSRGLAALGSKKVVTSGSGPAARSPSSSRSGKWAGAETEASRAECPGAAARRSNHSARRAVRCCRRTVSPACCPGSRARESPFSRSAEGR